MQCITLDPSFVGPADSIGLVNSLYMMLFLSTNVAPAFGVSSLLIYCQLLPIIANIAKLRSAQFT